MRRSERGSALLAAMLVVTVMAFVTVATLRLAQNSKTNAVRDARKLSYAACVDAARQQVIASVRQFGGSTDTITVNKVATVENGLRGMRTGHIGGGAATATVTRLSNRLFGGRPSAIDITNKIVNPSTGAYYTATVACSDPVVGDIELEFSFKTAF